MKKLKHLIAIAALLITNLSVDAQGPKESSVDQLMRSNGRIYVVVAVMVTILLGLIIYLVRIDRKIGKLEKLNR
ncbi:MAG: CcmD family protein [Chitinophagaceae bacterium]|nr:CcmD family protein [Chitinophagaceae bacterium]